MQQFWSSKLWHCVDLYLRNKDLKKDTESIFKVHDKKIAVSSELW
jgi:hypothetical protein